MEEEEDLRSTGMQLQQQMMMALGSGAESALMGQFGAALTSENNSNNGNTSTGEGGSGTTSGGTGDGVGGSGLQQAQRRKRCIDTLVV